jgi:DNA-binding GntR family transcriptional regulator
MAIIRNVNHSGERYTRLQLYLTHGVKRANEEHHQMLELCRKRNVEAACELLRRHIEHAGESLKEVLQQNRLVAAPLPREAARQASRRQAT